MQAAGGILGTPRHWARGLAIATAIGVFLGVIGPFGSFNGAGLELRVFFWVTNFWIGFALLSVGVRLALRIGGSLDLPVWFSLPVGVAVFALPVSLAVAAFASVAWPGARGQIRDLLAWYGQTLAIAEPCAVGFYFLTINGARYADLRRPETVVPASGLTATRGADLLDRLSPRLGRDLICLQMEDHYVRVHTAKGSELVLIPLKEAMAELTGIEGLQVHRSWWVARGAVAEAVSDGRNLRLRLVNGQEAPVSRASIARLRESGWLDR